MTAIYGPIFLGAPRKEKNKLEVKKSEGQLWTKIFGGPSNRTKSPPSMGQKKSLPSLFSLLSSLLSSFHLGFNFALFSALLFSLHFALVSFFFPFFFVFSPFLLFSLLSSLFPPFSFSSDHSHFAVKGIKLLGFLLKEHWNPIGIVFHGAQNSIRVMLK